MMLAPVMFVASMCLAEKDGKTVKVVRHSIQGAVVIIEIEINGNTAQLECTASVAHCSVPSPGTYSLVEMSAREGPYTECKNVKLYSVHPNPRNEVGVYCLLPQD